MNRAKVPLNVIASLSGHSSMNSLRLYLGVDESEQLDAIANLTPQEIKKAGFGAGYKHDVLMGTKDFNVSKITRMSGFIGSALSGMAFSAKRRDHRSVFNKRRGNRV